MISDVSQIQQISKFSNKVEHSLISKQSNPLDYTNTRFHNALIVKHDQAEAFSQELDNLAKAR
jgi:hypothetical protein